MLRRLAISLKETAQVANTDSLVLIVKREYISTPTLSQGPAGTTCNINDCNVGGLNRLADSTAGDHLFDFGGRLGVKIRIRRPLAILMPVCEE
jgi:hypothetical protein